MHDREAIHHALLTAGIRSPIQSLRNLSGGCIHTVVEIVLRDGPRLIAKVNSADSASMFESEAQSLRALGDTGAVLVPRPLACVTCEQRCVLLMTAIEPAESAPNAEDWRRFGR